MANGYGNGGSVFTSSESGNGEDAPALRTRVSVDKFGVVDIWVNFWANPAEDWRIQSGLSSGGMQVYRAMASKQVDSNAHTTSLTLTGSSNTHLYQAYLGRATVSASGSFDVYVDDNANKTGTASTLVGGTARTWYDGVSYAFAGDTKPNAITDNNHSRLTYALAQNYPNPFNPTTNIKFTIREPNRVTLKIYNIVGEEVATLVDKEMSSGSYTCTWDAKRMSSGIYIYKLTAGSFSAVNKMIVLK
jgi:hypothetical protein